MRKCTPIWDELEWHGISREGVGASGDRGNKVFTHLIEGKPGQIQTGVTESRKGRPGGKEV
jgi:hypothetical protein